MAYTEPVLIKRIDADPAKRKTHWYDDYVATGGYVALKKALDMKPDLRDDSAHGSDRMGCGQSIATRAATLPVYLSMTSRSVLGVLASLAR